MQIDESNIQTIAQQVAALLLANSRGEAGEAASKQTRIEHRQKDVSCPDSPNGWPPRPGSFRELLTPVEAAQYLRLDETGSHTPRSAIRTLTYWRDKGQLKATKYARRVWYRKAELDRFLEVKTEQ